MLPAKIAYVVRAGILDDRVHGVCLRGLDPKGVVRDDLLIAFAQLPCIADAAADPHERAGLLIMLSESMSATVRQCVEDFERRGLKIEYLFLLSRHATQSKGRYQDTLARYAITPDDTASLLPSDIAAQHQPVSTASATIRPKE